jgi:hypothetical protein
MAERRAAGRERSTARYSSLPRSALALGTDTCCAHQRRLRLCNTNTESMDCLGLRRREPAVTGNKGICVDAKFNRSKSIDPKIHRE